MLATAAPCTSPKAERFDRPVLDGLVFLLDSPALRTGLLSLSSSGTSPYRTILSSKLMRRGGRRFSTKNPRTPL